MTVKALIVTLVLGSSSIALADAAPASTQDHARAWTLLAAENHATKGNADKKPVSDPGILVDASRTPKQP